MLHVPCEDEEEPKVGMTFNSTDEVTRYYMNYMFDVRVLELLK